MAGFDTVGGADVHFVARGAHLAAMRRDGVAIEGGPDPIQVPRVSATDEPADIGIADLVLFAVKLWDTQDALRLIRPMVGPGTAIVSFQNGVLKDDYLRAAYDPRQIMGGVTYVATKIDRPGVIRQTGTMQRLVFGEFDGTRSRRAEAFLEACRRGGINAEIGPDIRRAIWEKFVFLSALAGATTTMRKTLGPIRENRQTRAFFRDLMREVVAVGRAEGVNLPEDFADQRLAFGDTLPADMTSSMHHDLQRGNRLEVGWLSGGVVKLGPKAGVPTPLNRAVADILALHADGRKAA
jgi:2-dehydropantoate 2-reductase